MAVIIGLEWARRLRGHRVGLEEFLEEWYERSAETCDRFENISEVDKYAVTCVICSHFEMVTCSSEENGARGPLIVALLKAACEHDHIPWEPAAGGGVRHHYHVL